MFEKLVHLITGYVKFEIKGESARFINIAARYRLTLWGYEKKEGASTAYIKSRDYSRLRPVKTRTGVGLRCLEKHGLPFYAIKLRKRKGIAIGALMFLILYSYLSGGVWDVQVSGNDRISSAQILNSARHIGIYEGARRSSIDPPDAALQLTTDMPGLSWVSINTDGSSVMIEVKELIEKPHIVTEEEPSNIVASRPGRILSIESQSGMQKVDIGDTVAKGQLLIAGEYAEEISPYVQKKAPIHYYLVPSRGDIIAETSREFKVEVSKMKTIEIETGKTENRYIIFFGLKIPLGLSFAPVGEHRKYVDSDMVELLGKELPVGIRRESYVYYERQTEQRREEELKQQALYDLRKLQDQAFAEGDTIIEETLDYIMEDEKYVLISRCRCHEEIGEKIKILGDITNNS